MKPELARSLFEYDPLTGELRWRMSRGSVRKGEIAGTRDRDGYLVVRYAGKGYKAHRVAWAIYHGEEPNGLIDHIDHCRSNNAAANLRVVDAQQNAEHIDPAKVKGRSGVRNVTWFSQYQKWKAMLRHKKRVYFIGHFDTVEEAAAAVASFRRQLRKGAVE